MHRSKTRIIRPEEETRICHMLSQGVTWAEISRRTGRSMTTVYRISARHKASEQRRLAETAGPHWGYCP